MHPWPCPWQAGAGGEPPASATSTSLPAAPLCRRGSAPRPQLCLALGQLQVLSSGKGAAGDAAEEEEGKPTNSLVLVWPCGSCVVTFQ